ncbi:GrpB family protein [Pseudalkalibacillus caeni]|uniref:GrpB family protein n=1 Tax=Exobacillus caeni TaxID=2574798 RepID=A0A5R9F996_9BACL|nr:GrpB family protein [Pseudalkalibacillus caeni]TLS38198.1 GrpB family protein [Pseudalkalibacillus caeni]
MGDKRKVYLEEHNPEWKNKYLEEEEKIKGIFGGQLENSYHIGSTSISGIKAKPVIDILLEVKDIHEVDRLNNAMEQLGYEAMGEHGIEGRRFFRKGGNNRTHHIHVFEKGNSEIKRHVNFRDYMRAHPEEARKYESLKAELAQKYCDDMEKYAESKSEFIREMDRKAELWLFH